MILSRNAATRVPSQKATRPARHLQHPLRNSRYKSRYLPGRLHQAPASRGSRSGAEGDLKGRSGGRQKTRAGDSEVTKEKGATCDSETLWRVVFAFVLAKGTYVGSHSEISFQDDDGIPFFDRPRTSISINPCPGARTTSPGESRPRQEPWF